MLFCSLTWLLNRLTGSFFASLLHITLLHIFSVTAAGLTSIKIYHAPKWAAIAGGFGRIKLPGLLPPLMPCPMARKKKTCATRCAA
jgi:hypothetical protein